MTQEEFTYFVQSTLEGVLQLAEERTGKSLPRRIAFCWWAKDAEIFRDGVVEEIVKKIYVDEGHIYPCVDIGVVGLLENGTPLIAATIAGYHPRPFQANWTGRDGPFVYIIGQRLLEKGKGLLGEQKIGDALRYSIPHVKSGQEG
jgi:hypothetical protein